MNRTAIWLAIGGLIAVMISCMPEPLELEGIDTNDNQVVVSSQIFPNGMFAVLVTKSFSPIATDKKKKTEISDVDLAINDAEVSIKWRGKSYRLDLLERGLYAARGIRWEEGGICNLYISSPGMKEVSSRAVVQQAVRFDTVRVTTTIDEYGKRWAEVQYQISDSPARNFYMLNVQSARRADVMENTVNPEVYTRLLKDDHFNGRKFTESFAAMKREFQPGDSVAVSITSVSHEYYDYVKMRIGNDHELAQLFSEPVNYPTNIEGGRGFFTLHIPDVKILVVE